jgi:iron complex outermembrane receptor protein
MRIPSSLCCSFVCSLLLSSARLTGAEIAATPSLRAAAAPETRAFSIPQGDAGDALRLFTRQSGSGLIYILDHVRGLRTNAVSGQLRPREALERMLANTPLTVVEDARTGALMVKRKDVPPPSSPMKQHTPKLLAVLLTAFVPDPVYAAAAGDETIVLSAFQVDASKDIGYRATNSLAGTKINTPLRDIPMNIQVVTADLMRDIGAIDGTEALKFQAGVEIRDRDGANYTSFRLRGYNIFWQYREGFRRYDVNDGVNIERIEIVAGPAAVFYGFSQPGGLINTINKRPTGKNSAALSYTYGTWNLHRAEIDANVTPAPGKLAMRFSASFTHQDDSWRDWDFLRRQVFAPVIAWRVSEKTRVVIDYEYLNQETGFTTNKIQDAIIDPATGNRTPINRFLDVPANRQWSGGDIENGTMVSNLVASVDHAFTDWLSLNAAANYYYHTQTRRSPVQRGIQVDALRDRNGALVRDASGNTIKAIRTWWADDPQANTVYNGRADLLATFATGEVRHKLLAGVAHTFDINPRAELRDGDTSTSSAGRTYRYFAVSDLNPDLRKFNNAQFNAPLYSSLALAYRDTQEFNSYYINHNAALFGDRLHTMIGARHDDFTYNRRRTANGLGLAINQNQQKWNPQFGVVFRPWQPLSFYALHNTSLEVPPVQTNSIGEVLANREGNSVEGGVKFEFLGGRLSGNVSVFEIRNKNIAISDPAVPRKLDGLPGENVTVGEQTTEGVDFSLFYSPVAGYSVIAGWSYVDTFVSKDTNPARIGQTFDILPYNRATFWNNYSFTQGELKGFSAGFGFRWTGQMDRGSGPSWRVNLADPASRIIKNDDFFVADAAVRYTTKVGDRPVELSLNALNLLDQEDQGGGIWIEPRNIRFTIGTRF